MTPPAEVVGAPLGAMGSARVWRDSGHRSPDQRNESLSASRIRRVAAVALAAAGLTAVAAPAAGASTMSISTTQSVVAPYDAGALLSNRNVLEGRGPVMLRVRHTMTCKSGDYHYARPYPICNWNSALSSGSARVVAGQGLGGDVYAVRTAGYEPGATYHWGPWPRARFAPTSG